MPLDGIFLSHLKNELEGSLVGSRVDKLHQPSKDDLVLFMRSRQGMSRLLISCSANSPRIHITSHATENPKSPPMLCMLLRKHLTSAVLTGFEQAGLDRVLFLNFDATNEIGDRVKLRLCVEIMAKHSNIILLREDGSIIDSVKRIDFTKSSVREILPGLQYTLPPSQNKLDLRCVEPKALIDRAFELSGKSLSSALLSVTEGVSPLIAREIAYRSCGDDVMVNTLTDNQRERLLAELAYLGETAKKTSGVPVLLRDSTGKPMDFSYEAISQYGSTVESVASESYSQLLDEFYYESDRLLRTHQRASDIFRLLSTATARLSKKLGLQRAELEAGADCDLLRIKGELISAHRYQLEKGALFYDLPNYYDGDAVLRISADPALSPSQNSEKYFKEYRKAKTAAQVLATLIEKGEAELQYLESVSEELARAETGAELDEIRAELAAGGYLRRRARKGAKAEKPLPPIEYTSSDGLRIFVGRNNLQNDRLTLKTAKGRDLWLHTQKIHGSHVIVETNGKPVPERTVREAAMLAAYHSDAKNSSGVPVDYTEVKNIKKPSGALPGKVIYHVYNTVWVTPDSELVERLKAAR